MQQLLLPHTIPLPIGEEGINFMRMAGGTPALPMDLVYLNPCRVKDAGGGPDGLPPIFCRGLKLVVFVGLFHVEGHKDGAQQQDQAVKRAAPGVDRAKIAYLR